MDSKSRLIFGCGYLGSRVAARWHALGDGVFAVTRWPNRAEALTAQGWQPIVADVTRPETLRDLPRVDTVLYAVGHDRGSGKTMREVYVDGLCAVLNAMIDRTSRFLYVSSTGVYGQTDGSWVDESSPCEPTRESGRVCLEAENALRDHALVNRSVVLRLAGIYGPGRLPNRDALLAGEEIESPEEGFLNLIHVEDAASVVVAAADHPSPSSLYLVSDGHPASRREYYAEAARLLGATPPRFAPPREGSAKLDRAAGNRRIDNTRMLAELPVRLAYPSFREGLAAHFPSIRSRSGP
jgi:nucleoside-diphosphate-sugar epimerase